MSAPSVVVPEDYLHQFILQLRRRSRRVATLSAIAALAALLAYLLAPREYVSNTTFLPQVRRASEFAGLAASLGVVVAGQESGQSPTFFAMMLRSRPVVDAVLRSTYHRDAGDTAGTPLYRALDRRPDPSRTMRSYRKPFLDSYEVNTKRATGVVEISVRTRTPELSLFIAQQLLAELDRFNFSQRSSRARAEERYAIALRDSALKILRANEYSLANFVQRNREYRTSPELQLAYDTLSRRVLFAQSQYSSWLLSAEQARVEAIRDTPVIAIVEPPEVPVAPDKRLGKALAAVTVVIWLLAIIVLGGGPLIRWRPFPWTSTGRTDAI